MQTACPNGYYSDNHLYYFNHSDNHLYSFNPQSASFTLAGVINPDVYARITSIYPDIKDVIFNPPATIILWTDGTKTVVKCQDDDEYDARMGVLLCIAKKFFGNTGKYNDVLREWTPEEEEEEKHHWSDNEVTIASMMCKGATEQEVDTALRYNRFFTIMRNKYVDD